MATSILATKLFIPPPRPKIVLRPRLIERLNEGLHRKLTLISAPVGYGKTTMLSEWIPQSERCVTWVSLDDGDNDPVRFWAYFIAALQMLDAKIGRNALALLQTPLLPPFEAILTILLNEIAAFPDNFALVLDDYHVIDAKLVDAATSVDDALTFLLEHLPPQMHLVITSREDPSLPLARLRARDQLTELRAADLRFTPAEAAEFLNQVMGLNLSAEDIATLENRTEGWIAGLQLAALSTRGREDVHEFIRDFAGDNRYIVDYLVEEVLQRQSERVRSFLLQTSILDWLSGPLCDAVTDQEGGSVLLEALERGNLFVSPLDYKRHWFRYHHLFADVLQAHLMAEQPDRVPTLHRRASEWYEHNGLEIEAFQHAAAANDVERAERLIEGEGMPLQFRGAGAPVLNWLKSLPKIALDARPSLWVTYASTLLFGGRPAAVEQKLQAAEAALLAHKQGAEPDDRSKDLVGRIASMRATLAVIQHDVETIIAQSRRALEYLHPDNMPVRTATTWTLGYAYQLQGDRAAASQAYNEVISIGKSFGDSIYTTAATINLGQLQEADNQLSMATETYRRALQLAGDPPQRMASEAFLGLARIYYEWNDLVAAQQHGQLCAQLARQMESVSTSASYGVFLARLRLAQRDVSGAIAVLDEAEEFVRRHNFEFMMPEIAAAQVITMLHQGNLAAAAHLAVKHELPISQARVHLAQGDPATALAVLEPLRQQVEAKGWEDERLKVMVLQAIALHAVALRANGEMDRAVKVLGDALALAEPGGFIRIFVDEGQSMAYLLNETLNRGIAPNYVQRLLTAFPFDETEQAISSQTQAPKSELDEPLSQRELEVLRLIAQGLSNREISERLFLALNTVKGHNRKIFGKLQVQRRTEAVARARELDLL
ncbi:MAG TPA: LuxR C-terminal-related transcriptional regulator [Anaerolineales bacterium]|nr:LuxR C-terminal-related transcriptional regulator [Anaerolineales bacterium]